jgi:hypothetical protein
MNALVKESYGEFQGSWWYGEIDPYILVEELLISDEKKLPKEYKVYCFRSEGDFDFIVRKIVDRLDDKKRGFFDRDWNKLDWSYEENKEPDSLPSKPNNFGEIIRLSKNLSEDFRHVRVDLMEHEGELFFGELTFADMSGFVNFEPEDWDYKFGDMWKIN